MLYISYVNTALGYERARTNLVIVANGALPVLYPQSPRPVLPPLYHSPDHPDPRSPRSAMDRRRCPREVTQLTSSLVNPDYLSDSHGAYLQKQTGALRSGLV